MILETKIRECRESVGMKQSELAERVNVRRERLYILRMVSIIHLLNWQWISRKFLGLPLKKFLSLQTNRV